MLKILITIMLNIGANALASPDACNSFVNLDGFEKTKTDDRITYSTLNDYLNVYHHEDKPSDLSIVTYKSENLFASKFKINTKSKERKTTVLLIYNERAQTVSVIENGKILFCAK